MQTQKKHRLKQLRQWRIRKKVIGTKERPRMSVCFTNENIYVQFISSVVLVVASAQWVYDLPVGTAAMIKVAVAE